MPTTVTLQPTGQVLTVPCSWQDVTLGQFIALLAPEPEEPRTAAELLLGLDAGGLGNLAADSVPYLANLLAFVADTSPVLQAPVPVGLPDVGALPWHCVLSCQDRFQAEPDRPELYHLPFVLALYRCQLTYNSTGKVEQVLAAVLDSPVLDVWGEAIHFLKGSRHFWNGTAPSPKTKPTTMTKRRWLARWSWPKDLAQRFRSTR